MEIRQNDRLGLVGPTGSGKSSLLRAIAILDPCKHCVVQFHGTTVTSEAIPAYRRKVIYLPQRPALVASSVRDNLMLPFRIGSPDSDYQESKPIALLDKLGKPSSFLDRPADALSGGERQFVSLVRAMQLDPQVLLLDEPTASLDATSSRMIEDLVMAWQSESVGEDCCRAYVLVSHDANQIARMSHRRLSMQDGSIHESDNDV